MDYADLSPVVAVRGGSVVDASDDLNVCVMMKLEAGVRLYLVIVEDDEISHRLVSRIAIRPDGEMVPLSRAVTVEELGADAVGRESRVATPPESAPLLERSEGSNSGPESSAGAHRRTPTSSTTEISTGFSVGTAKKFCGVQAPSRIRLPFRPRTFSVTKNRHHHI
jgi:hypothetical protein